MENKVQKPKDFTDAEAEAFTRYLTQTKKRKKKLGEIILKTDWGRNLFDKWLRKRREGKNAI
ncbi:MAG: hypothetical protein KKC55_15390 [Gammaproteobacteria bacterium]|nr:hypothetical protein [Gammaproteobacteria bacterium]